MMLLEIVRNEMLKTFAIKQTHDGVRVVTQHIYPSSSFVNIVIRGGEKSFYASDEGSSLDELENAGGEIVYKDRMLRHIADKHGLYIEKGVIKSPFIEAAAIPVVSTLVALASVEAAHYLFEKARINPQRNIKKLVNSYLMGAFTDKVEADQIILGKSNKPHRFDNLVRLNNGRRLIVDPVVYQPTAINAHVVANLDVAAAQYSDIEQRIIYDDADNWRAEDLNLLQVGATVVPFSRAPEVITRLASDAG
jgi:hypothetical protein